MKLIFLCLILLIPLVSSAGQGKGGGNFDYMRSFRALKSDDYKVILSNDGQSFFQEVIMPTFLLAVVEFSSSDIESLYTNPSLMKRKIPNAELREMWKSILGKKSGLELEADIMSLKLKDCSCPDNLEDEYATNHACSFQEEKRICLDMGKIFNEKKPMNIDFNELTAMVWHEITHLFLGDADHDNEMVFFRDILKKSERGEMLRVHPDYAGRVGTCEILKPQKQQFEDSTLESCVEKILGFEAKAVKAKFLNVSLSAKYPSRYDRTKELACYFSSPYHEDRETNWSLWLTNYTFLKRNRDYHSYNSLSGVAQSGNVFASQIFPRSQNIYSTGNLGSVSTIRKNSMDCVWHTFYAPAGDDNRLFAKGTIVQGDDFQLTVD